MPFTTLVLLTRTVLVEVWGQNAVESCSQEDAKRGTETRKRGIENYFRNFRG